MNNPTSESAIIRPEILASNIAALENMEASNLERAISKHPNLVELLWYLQAKSMQPGGLKRFAADFMAKYSDRIGNPEMWKIGHKNYSQEDLLKVYHRIPEHYRRMVKGCENWILENFDPLGSLVELREDKSLLAQALTGLDYNYFYSFHKSIADRELPGMLLRLCTEKDNACNEAWFFDDLVGCLIRFMRQDADSVKARLAMTEVALKVFDALDFAYAESALVRIEGDSRFGKTESVKTWCAMYPGRARLVSAPCSNCEADLFKSIAEALGIDFSFRTSSREIKEKVEYVIRHSRLMIVFDEAHFLLPTRFSQNTHPMRLNWVRTQIVDRKRAVVLVSTPQDYKHCLSEFVKATGHNIQQFLGRTMLNVILPNALEEDDLIAVAKIHFPDLDEHYLSLIAAKAMQSESYLMAVEQIAKRARWIASRDNHPEMTLDDLKVAIAEALPPQQLAQRKEPRGAKNRGISLDREQLADVPHGRRDGVAIAQNFENSRQETGSRMTGLDLVPVT